MPPPPANGWRMKDVYWIQKFAQAWPTEFVAVILGSVPSYLVFSRESSICTWVLSTSCSIFTFPFSWASAKPLGFTGGAKALTAFPVQMATSRGLSEGFPPFIIVAGNQKSDQKKYTWRKKIQCDPITSPTFAFLAPRDRCGSTNLLRVLCRLSGLLMRKRDPKNGSTNANIP